MSHYSKEIIKHVDEAIPVEIREALSKFGWNELGVYEAVKKAILKGKKEGGKITSKSSKR